MFNNRFDSNVIWDVGLSQDARRSTEPNAAVCPWLVRNVTIANNVFGNAAGGSKPGYQVYALDKETHISVDAMKVAIDGNLFSGESSTKSARMAAWGASDNRTLTIFSTPSALATAKNHSWTNAVTATQNPARATTDALRSNAVPMPADIASAIGVAAGGYLIGP